MSKPLVTNAANESQVKEAGSKIKDLRMQELNDMRAILSMPQGRRFVWRYLTHCKVFQSTFNHSGSITSFNEGMRNVGLMMLSDVNDASPESYLTMMKESKEN